MDLPSLGHAVIVNNVAEEMPGSQADVEALRSAYQKVGFEVQVHINCTDLVNYLHFSIVLNLRDRIQEPNKGLQQGDNAKSGQFLSKTRKIRDILVCGPPGKII